MLFFSLLLGKLITEEASSRQSMELNIMGSNSRPVKTNHKMVIWKTINPFFSGLAGVGLGLLVGFYLGLI